MARHHFDPVSLVAGILFAGIGIAGLTGELEFSAGELRWLWPIAILALGLALLVGTDRGAARERGEPSPPPVSDEER